MSEMTSSDDELGHLAEDTGTTEEEFEEALGGRGDSASDSRDVTPPLPPD